MPKLTATDLDVSRLLFDLKLCADLVRQFTGWLETDAIATCVTDGLVDRFSCAFARIWLVNRDRTALCLVASSGLYTRLDGSFALVPMGAFKVGKIAQHCIPFLSNRLADEEWVKDREWAIDNKIQGFAGLPLMVKDQAIGVLAVFSHAQMAPEFLEVLQILSMSVTGALASALNHQGLMDKSLAADSLSEQLANILGRQKLSLLGTEQMLSASVTHLLVQTAQQLVGLSCHYCRLVYEADAVTLEAMLASPNQTLAGDSQNPMLHGIAATADCLGGTYKAQLGSNQKVIQLRLRLPYQTDLLASANGPPTRNSPLSEREQEVIKLLAQGQRDRDIAERLYISERTVKFHVKNMLKKLGVRTRIQAVFEATQKGWLR
ncbi:LuxR C-terminal-related transcriptional regulator [Leptolyngbya sp. BC1307]|uniref:LuxR C-terminal-related transcriptional regulator n=1 Tax=Leptolyngbya sp. BC1307 TaxID=2029589 RepID=UPI001F0A3EED|nr:LuxR C-terminal-related transcriptional regulator [Leptolyngbya sp. BC1307]